MTVSGCLVIGLFALAGAVMIGIALKDWETRLITLRALLVLLILRVGIAFCVFRVDCTAPDASVGIETVYKALCEQLSWESLLYSGGNALLIVVVLTFIRAIVDGVITRRGQYKRSSLFAKEVSLFDINKNHRDEVNAKLVLQTEGERAGGIRYGKGESEERSSLGSGDIKLIGVCCLYLSTVQLALFLLVTTLMALLMTLYFLFRHNDTTFPCAPAIVSGCLIAFVF